MTEDLVPAHRRLPSPILWIATIILLFAASWYVSRGLHRLTLSELIPGFGDAIDLRLRWTEFRYITWHHRNPFDLYLAHEPEGPVTPPGPFRGDTTLDDSIGPVTRAPYPPWSYITGAPLWTPRWTVARWWAAVTNLAALAIIAAWAYFQARPIGRPEAAFLATFTLACAHHYTILALGQLTIYVIALLVVSLVCANRRHNVLAGLFLGLAMLKPTIAAPFLLAYLVKGNLRAVVCCLGYMAVTSSLIWGWTGASPWEMLRQMSAIAEQIEIPKREPGPITWLMHIGLAPGQATKAMTVITILPCCILLWFNRRRSYAEMFAIAALAAQLWTHHKSYDEIVLLLLMVPLIAITLGRADRPGILITALLGGLTILHLGVFRMIPNDTRIVLQILLWAINLGLLLGAPKWRTKAENSPVAITAI